MKQTAIPHAPILRRFPALSSGICGGVFRQHLINFIAFLGQLYPCKVCRLNLQQELRHDEVQAAAAAAVAVAVVALLSPFSLCLHGAQHRLAWLFRWLKAPPWMQVTGGTGPAGEEYYGIHEAATSRQKLGIWLCRLHNIVNRDLGKEETECTNIGMDMQYLKNCGEW